MVKKNRILFVDDEPNVLAGIRRSLRPQAEHWEMTFAESPEHALQEFDHDAFDVVVSDLAMPGINGLELAHALKEKSARVQVVMLTGTADLQTAIQAINETDILRFYTKPCPPDDLISGIQAGLAEIERLDLKADAGNSGFSNFSEAALDHLPIGVVVVDATGNVEFMNPRAAEIVSNHDGLFVGPQGVLHAERTDDSDALLGLIRKMASGDEAGEGGAIAINRPSMQRALSVRAFLLDNQEAGSGGRVGLFLTDPESRPEISSQVIAKLFGLTDSESRLVAALACGERLEEAAESTGVTVSTARTYLKQVFSKTDTSRQAELVQLVLTSAATLSRRQ